MKKIVRTIFGPPGTGKTRYMVNQIVERQCPRSLYLSFTRAAAAEALSRVINNTGVYVATIHSMAFRALDLAKESVVDDKSFIEFCRATGFPAKGGEDGVEERQEGDEYKSVLSFAKNRMIAAIDAYDHFGRPGNPSRFEHFCKSYQNWKESFGFLDFDDMLLLFAEKGSLMQVYPDVYLDEAQDCSPLQWQAFKKICANSNTFVAGDDDQAIYEWNGADPHGMMDFSQTMANQSIVLGTSYRLPEEVRVLAHYACLTQMRKRVDKDFTSRGPGGEGTVLRYGDVLHLPLASLSNDGGAMVLARDRWRLDEIKRLFNRDLIPYEVLGGHSPWTNSTAAAIRAGKEVTWNSKNIVWKSFYDQVDLDQPIKFTLSTIHQAKGREADTVVVDLTLPGRVQEAMQLDPDSELRVLYVALTRARKRLLLCSENPML